MVKEKWTFITIPRSLFTTNWPKASTNKLVPLQPPFTLKLPLMPLLATSSTMVSRDSILEISFITTFLLLIPSLDALMRIPAQSLLLWLVAGQRLLLNQALQLPMKLLKPSLKTRVMLFLKILSLMLNAWTRLRIKLTSTRLLDMMSTLISSDSSLESIWKSIKLHILLFSLRFGNLPRVMTHFLLAILMLCSSSKLPIMLELNCEWWIFMIFYEAKNV